MTTGLTLYTLQQYQYVQKIAEVHGFSISDIISMHNSIVGLGVQIHDRSNRDRLYNTIIEFDDYTDRFPDNPLAVGILNGFYKFIPDLKYSEIAIFGARLKPLSDFFSTLS
ncbi:MAG: hypothetical protein ABIJ18_03820 [archaeon]